MDGFDQELNKFRYNFVNLSWIRKKSPLKALKMEIWNEHIRFIYFEKNYLSVHWPSIMPFTQNACSTPLHSSIWFEKCVA